MINLILTFFLIFSSGIYWFDRIFIWIGWRSVEPLEGRQILFFISTLFSVYYSTSTLRIIIIFRLSIHTHVFFYNLINFFDLFFSVLFIHIFIWFLILWRNFLSLWIFELMSRRLQWFRWSFLFLVEIFTYNFLNHY